jgi:hypothetical protein
VKTFDVQSVVIGAPFERVFAFLADAGNLPRWTSAFKSVSGGRALMQTPGGYLEIQLQVNASRQQGTVDWQMAFPDGSVETVYSRVVPDGDQSCIYSFLLMPRSVALEQLEGALEQQSATLREELRRLTDALAAR